MHFSRLKKQAETIDSHLTSTFVPSAQSHVPGAHRMNLSIPSPPSCLKGGPMVLLAGARSQLHLRGADPPAHAVSMRSVAACTNLIWERTWLWAGEGLIDEYYVRNCVTMCLKNG